MNISVQQAQTFLNPLRGRVTTFFIADRVTNLSLGMLFLASVAAENAPCTIIDTDAFYASNSGLLTKDLPTQSLERIQLYVPEVGIGGQEVALTLFKQTEHHTFIVDNLNTLFHTLSSENQSSAGRKLVFLTALQSFTGRENGATFLTTVYEREKPTPTRRQKSFRELGDASVSAKLSGDELILRCERGLAWPSRTLNFSIRSSE